MERAQVPKKKHKKIISFGLGPPGPINTNFTENQYESLQDDDESDSSVSIVHNPAKKLRSQQKWQFQQQQNTKLARASTSQHTPSHLPVSKKAPLPPPIIIENTRIQVLIEHLKPLNLPADKLKYKLGRKHIRVYTSDTTTHNAVCEKIRETKLPGFTHTPKDERFTRICLYGLYPMNTTLISEEMKKYKAEPNKVRLMYQNADHPDEAIYVLYYMKKHGITAEKLNQITGLFNLTTKFRNYSNKATKFTQCSNCQSLGHGTQNCFKTPVCVRCAEPHKSSECPLIPTAMEDGNNSGVKATRPKIEEDKL